MAKPPAVRAEQRPVDVFKSQLTLAMPTLRHMVPAHVTPEKFQAMVVTAVAYDKNLLECSTESLIRETAQAAELGLSLNKSLREADILTVWNASAGRKEAQMRPRYMGLMKLARQSGEILDICAHVVKDGDEFDYTLGTAKTLHHRPGKTRGDVTHSYCVWTLKDGSKAFDEPMSRDDLERIRDRSEGYKAFKANKIKSTPWDSDFEEMCRKTAVRRASKYMPISNEKWASAIARDDAGDSSEPPLDGDYVDVTESHAPEPSSTPARNAADKLAEKIGATPAATSPTVARLDVPADLDDKPDYFEWADRAAAVLVKLDAPAKKAWLTAHADIMKSAPQEVTERLGG